MKLQMTLMAGLGLLGAPGLHAEEAAALGAVRVTADRYNTSLVSPARQTTVITQAEIQSQMNSGASLAEVLAKLVPGMGQPSQTFTNTAQGLRGRKALVLVDGVPMSTNRDVSRTLFNVSADSIERIEVIRGGSAIYGSGATGGVIAITTREASARHENESGIGFNSPASFESSDGLGYRAFHGMSGSLDAFDYAGTVSYEYAGAKFDADGVRIAPEPSQGDMFDADIWEVSTKLGWNPSLDQRLQLTLLHYQAEQDTDYASNPAVTQQPLRSVKASAIKGLKLDEQNTARNEFVSLEYSHDDILAGTLHGQLYYREYLTRFYPFDSRGSASNRHLAQTELDAIVSGGRLTLTTPMQLLQGQETELQWGADLQKDESSMPVITYDGDIYDASGGLVFESTGRKTYMPPITNQSRAAFAQLRHGFNPVWAVDLGIRYEHITTEFDDFITLPQTLEPDPLVTRGGEITYESWFGNGSVIFAPMAGQEWYLAYNQGFELPDIGLQVRNARPEFDLESSDLEALKTDTVELGWRGDWERVQGTLAVYRSSSDLGRVQTENFGLTLFRNKEVIRGVEATLDAQLTPRWRIGSTFTLTKGEEKPDGGEYSEMNGFRISPMKITTSVQHQLTENWWNRLQAMYSASHDYRTHTVEAFGKRDVESYWVLDWLSRWQFATSHLDLGLENLLNEDYYPVYSQLLRSSTNTSHIPARGRTLRLSYVVQW